MGNDERKIMHKVLDLFSGIGGFSLGLERTGGFETVAFCETDNYCQKVLKKHWVDVPMYDDIKELTNDRLKSQGIFPTVITGGFPCQDLSHAKAKSNSKGIGGERSGLVFEIIRLVREIRPEYFILENVSALLAHREFSRLLGEFSQIGNYVVEWHCISASQIGAPHRRDRVWIIGRNTDSNSKSVVSINDEAFRVQKDEGNFGKFWKNQPKFVRVVDGISTRLDRHRLEQLGNSLVPQIPEIIGNAILEHEKTD